MKKGDRLFVRADHRIKGKEFGPSDFEDHVAYLKNVSKERFFMGGGYVGATGGMIVFAAKDIDEANQVAGDDPIMQRGLYTYELKEWELAIVSDNKNYIK